MEDFFEAYAFSERIIREVYTQISTYHESSLKSSLKGRYETFMPKFIECVQHASLCVDIGSEFGAYTFLAAREMPDDGIVYAIEAKPERFSAFYQFIQARSELRSRIFPINFLISGANSEIEFFTLDYKISSSLCAKNFPRKPADSPTSSIKLPCTTMNALFSGRKIDVLKIDIEGAEVFMLDAMDNVLSQRPKIFMEVHGGQSQGLRHDAIEYMAGIFDRFAYDSYSFDSGVMQKVNFRPGRLYLCPREARA